MLWTTLVAGQSRLPKENNPLAVDVIAEVIGQKASNYKRSYYDALAIYKDNFLHKVYL